ncbi:unnamed protein product [Adineta steineri]|uniref:Uncharacterized protein n=1 Tax=Adineta steineri TaxID=433720 RepID=A0A814KZT7_9BILA|nr:unnamed protein product [Adineta steineri]
MNSYSNKNILIDLKKLQMNEDSKYLSFVTLINCPLNLQNDSSGMNNYAFIDQIFNENVFYQIPKIDHTQQEEEEVEIKNIKSSELNGQLENFCICKSLDIHSKQIINVFNNLTYFMKICSFIYFPLDSSKHSVSSSIKIHTDDEPCLITFYERLCFEMTTDLDETRLQVFFFLPVNVYVEDSIVRNKTDQHLSTGCLQSSGLSIRGHAMLSHEGLPPEREILEYACLDSIDLNLIEVENAVNIQVRNILSTSSSFIILLFWIAPIHLCMCDIHTSLCNESLTLKVGIIQIRQLLRLYPGSWLKAGSISVPELRINAKFECHPPTPATINEQLEFLPTNSNILSCACLGGSTNYYTLVQGEQFFKSTFRLSEQSVFGRSLFRPDLHVLHSHFIFEHIKRFHDELDDKKVFYPSFWMDPPLAYQGNQINDTDKLETFKVQTYK